MNWYYISQKVDLLRSYTESFLKTRVKINELLRMRDGESGTDDDIKLLINPEVLGLTEQRAAVPQCHFEQSEAI